MRQSQMQKLSGHCCRACKLPVHSWAQCDKVWQPEFGAYFCSRDCVMKYNGDAEIRSTYVDTDPLPVKHRPDDDSEDEAPAAPQNNTAGPVMRTLQRHSGAEFEAGDVGHRNSEARANSERANSGLAAG